MSKFITIINKTINKTFKTMYFILKIVIPVLFITTLLNQLDLLVYIGNFFSPITALFGLPGDTIVPLILGNGVNLYAGIASLAPIQLSSIQFTIISVMLLISHSLFVEVAVFASVGIKKSWQVGFRVLTMIIIGIIANLIFIRSFQAIDTTFTTTTFYATISKLFSISFYANLLQVYIIALLKMIWSMLQIITLASFILVLLEEFDFLKHINNISYKLTKHLGLSKEANTPLLVGMIVGISFGASAIVMSYKDGKLTKKDVVLVTTFLMMAHALIEDTILFGRIGANVFAILFSRIILAIILTLIVNKLYPKIRHIIEKSDLNESNKS